MTPRRRIIPVFVPHLGCKHQCVFCDQKQISGRAAPAGPETVQQVLSSAQASTGGAELAFYGGSFTAVPRERQRQLLEAAQPYLASGLLSSIRVSTRPDCVDPEALDLLAAYRVETVELGAQSMDEAVLRASGRGHGPEDTRNAASLLRERGFRVILQMMTGLPGADDLSDLRTAESLAALEPDGVRIYPTVVLRDTPLAELWRRGLYRARTVEQAVETCAPIAALFLRAGIPIIRLGLNPDRELESRGVLAGAYHPALGELVYARLYRQRAEERIAAMSPRPERLTILVSPDAVSRMTGQHRENLTYLQGRFGLAGIRVRTGEIPRGELEILADI